MSATDSIYKAIYRVSGGRLGHNIGTRRVLLLTTIGRRSGKRRTTPLVYMPITNETPGVRLSADEGFLVAGSNWGGPRDPAWLLNLDAQPHVTVQAGTRRHEVSARRATPEEAAALWPVACGYNDHWAGYREQCEREIPLIILEPRAPA
jgi:deazaflavin-dependent oxidoreductase (nitroreductase family)